MVRDRITVYWAGSRIIASSTSNSFGEMWWWTLKACFTYSTCCLTDICVETLLTQYWGSVACWASISWRTLVLSVWGRPGVPTSSTCYRNRVAGSWSSSWGVSARAIYFCKMWVVAHFSSRAGEGSHHIFRRTGLAWRARNWFLIYLRTIVTDRAILASWCWVYRVKNVVLSCWACCSSCACQVIRWWARGSRSCAKLGARCWTESCIALSWIWSSCRTVVSLRASRTSRRVLKTVLASSASCDICTTSAHVTSRTFKAIIHTNTRSIGACWARNRVLNSWVRTRTSNRTDYAVSIAPVVATWRTRWWRNANTHEQFTRHDR